MDKLPIRCWRADGSLWGPSASKKDCCFAGRSAESAEDADFAGFCGFLGEIDFKLFEVFYVCGIVWWFDKLTIGRET